MSGHEKLALELQMARRIVVFTGAGISTESGIPDFRSPGGVWSKMKPIYFQDFLASESKRWEAWSRVFSDAAGWLGREPNAGHYAVASLIASGRASAVITQNVDNLHQLSGVPEEHVIELHGNASFAKCLACGLRHELDELRKTFVEQQRLPVCLSCGGLVKSATISFGQPMPRDQLERAEVQIRACDLLLVLGSSLVVTPAAHIPVKAKRNGARLAIVNLEPTPLDRLADIVLNEQIGPVITAAVSALG